jgi:hypothetical protein
MAAPQRIELDDPELIRAKHLPLKSLLRQLLHTGGPCAPTPKSTAETKNIERKSISQSINLQKDPPPPPKKREKKKRSKEPLHHEPSTNKRKSSLLLLQATQKEITNVRRNPPPTSRLGVGPFQAGLGRPPVCSFGFLSAALRARSATDTQHPPKYRRPVSSCSLTHLVSVGAGGPRGINEELAGHFFTADASGLVHAKLLVVKATQPPIRYRHIYAIWLCASLSLPRRCRITCRWYCQRLRHLSQLCIR